MSSSSSRIRFSPRRSVAYDAKTLTDKARKELRRLVERTIASLRVPMSSVTLDVAVGKPHEEILWTADHLKCDIIVMGAHGRTGTDKLMMGSTTHRILRRSALPVLATPPVSGRARGPAKGWPGSIVIAPVDIGSRDSADALAAAVVARELGTKLACAVVEHQQSTWGRCRRRRHIHGRAAPRRITQLKDERKGLRPSGRVRKAGRRIATIASADPRLVV